MKNTNEEYAKKIDAFLRSSSNHIGHTKKKDYQGWVFFVDVDNTLINNDAIKKFLKKKLEEILGEKEARRFWSLHAQFRSHQKLVDFPKIIREYCNENHADSCHTMLFRIFFKVPFSQCVYKSVPKNIAYLQRFGPVNIFTEGDAVYQEAKVTQSGLSDLVDKVFLFKHKLEHIEDVLSQYPDLQPVFLDDRLKNLAAVAEYSEDVVTVHVEQGSHSQDNQENFKPTFSIPNLDKIEEYVFD